MVGSLRFGRIFSIPLVCAFSALSAPPVLAVDTASTAAASTNAVSISQVQLIAESSEQSIFQIRFAPNVGSFSTVITDSRKPGLRLADTRRAQSAVSPPRLRGLVRTIDFEQADDSLTLLFRTAAPAKITTSPGGDRILLVTIKKLAPGEKVIRESGDARGISGGDGYADYSPVPGALDRPPGQDGFEMIQLNYADVSEVVGLLSGGVTVKPNNTFIRREPGFGSPGTGGGNYGQMPLQEEEDREPLGQAINANIAIDRRLNAIWVTGSPGEIARIKSMIAAIDLPVDSVLLETQFVELTETGARNLGIDFTNANGQIAVGTVQSGQYTPFGFDVDKPLTSFSLQAAIYAQIQKGEGRILSKPRIAAQSGATAKIITGDALPILTAITLSGVNGVSQQVQYVNVGVTLQIAPRVSQDNYVTSHIYAVVSSVTGVSQGYPTISQREAETSASVRDGESFVIGGLTQENVLSTKSKVPLLGDIPLIGQAFRVEKTSRTKTELYIVITPRIIRHRRFGEDGETYPAVPTGNPPTVYIPDREQ